MEAQVKKVRGPDHDPSVRGRILELRSQGVKIKDIATQLSVKKTYVQSFLSKNGGKLTKEQRRANVADGRKSVTPVYPEGTTEKVLELKNQGMSRQQIAKTLNLDINKVTSDLQLNRDRWQGLTSEQRSDAHRRFPKEVVNRALEMRRAGVSAPKIEEALGVGVGTLFFWFKQNDLRLAPEQYRMLNRQYTDAQRECIVELRKTGLTYDAIGERLDIPWEYVKWWLMKVGYKVDREVASRNVEVGKSDYYARVRDKFFALVADRRGLAISDYVDTETDIDIKCEAGHVFKLKPKRLINNHNWCKSCFRIKMKGVYSIVAQRALANVGVESHLEWYQKLAFELGGKCLAEENVTTHASIEWECAVGHRWTAKANTIISGHWCRSCSHVGPSKGQLEMATYVSSLIPFEDVVVDAKNVLSLRRELDVFVPSFKFAMEYNGLLWHSSWSSGWEAGKEKAKADECRALGIKFFMVFSDEWIYKQDLVKAMISRRLGVSQATKLFARKLELRRLAENSAWNSFFEINHLEGSRKAQWGYGLFLGDALVMCGTVYKNRFGEMELARLATDFNYSIAGGAGRIIKAIKEKTGDLVSFSNNRLSNGDVYRVLGAKDITETTAPSYCYTDGRMARIDRQRCQRINDPGILSKYPEVPHTERDQAFGGVFSDRIFGDRRPLYRLEDCGHQKWLL